VNNNLDYQPVFIIGAARSGTRLLRDSLAIHPEVDSVPYDINYIWRLGNEQHPHDELRPALLTPEIKKRILQQFSSYRKDGQILIEKTVSNCLRVDYVQNVFPNALFLHLLRDGVDVVESVYRQWLAPPDWNYIFKKAKMFPIEQAFGYAYRYALKTFRKIFLRNRTEQDIWGPHYAGIEEDLLNNNLLEVGAIQWAHSVEKALDRFEHISERKAFTIRYENFVGKPRLTLKQIARFLSISPAFFDQRNYEEITQSNIGKGRNNLAQEQKEIILAHIQPTIERVDAL
jgi:hypothetical protein